MPVSLGAVRRDYWLCQFGGWGLYTVVVLYLSLAGEPGAVGAIIGIKLWGMASGISLTHQWRRVLRRRGWLDGGRRVPFGRLLFGILALSLAQMAIVWLAYVLLRRPFLAQDMRGLPMLVPVMFFVFLVWTLAYAVVHARRRALRLDLEKLQLEVSIKDIELRALRAQLNAHFFFNSLNSIRALMFEDVQSAADTLDQLAGMMRYSLGVGQHDTVRLVEELDAVRAYLCMEKTRFDERLEFVIEVEAGLDDVAIPPMALQTLVENAVKHGVEPSMEGCAIRIGAIRVGGCVTLCVANQGRLAGPGSSNGLGLANTAKRLELLFGAGASCSLAEEAGWVVARVVLPPLAS
jgi:signal transduction histidine kinase